MVLNLNIRYREAERDGVWAWDCEHKEPILIFPTVLALLGDNPMHSEFACHIGLQGKFFCCSCWVKGSDADELETYYTLQHVTRARIALLHQVQVVRLTLIMLHPAK